MTTYLDVMNFGVKWPYSDYYCCVLTLDNLEYNDANIKGFITLKTLQENIKEYEEDIYIVGGGQIAGKLIDLGLIDKVILTINTKLSKKCYHMKGIKYIYKIKDED